MDCILARRAVQLVMSASPLTSVYVIIYSIGLCVCVCSTVRRGESEVAVGEGHGVHGWPAAAASSGDGIG